MKHAYLAAVAGTGVLLTVLVLLSLRPGSLGKPVAQDYRQPLPGRAPFVQVADLVSDPARYDGKRLVLEGIWRTGFEVSVLELVESQKFMVWVDIWDSSEFASESKSFFDRESSGLIFGMPASFGLRAEGSFYYRPRNAGGAFGHLGSAEALFLVDRILMLERKDPEKPNKAPEPTPTSVTSPAIVR